MIDRLTTHIRRLAPTHKPDRRADDRRSAGARRRRPPDRDRGQVIQLGFLLAVVVLITLLATLQVTVAPNVQASTEFDHAAAVLEDMQGVGSDTLAAATTPGPKTTVVRMGSNYPNFVVLMQPPGPWGTLRTTDTQTVELTNAEAVRPETADFVDGSTISYETTALEYEPSYNQFENPPTTVVRQTTVYQKTDENQQVVASSDVVSGQQITLITTTGDMDTTRTNPMSLETVALSRSTSTVRVQDDSGSPVTIRIQSELSVETWRQMLGSEIDGDTSAGSPSTDNDGRFIAEIQEDTSTSPSTIEIVMETGVNYQLSAAKVGHLQAEQASFPDSEVPDEQYLTTEMATTQVATEEETIELTVEVRDKFHNGVSEVVVDGTVVTSGSLAQSQRLSTEDGTVTFRYTAPEITQPTSSVSSQTHQVRFELTAGTGQEITVRFDIEVQNTHN